MAQYWEDWSGSVVGNEPTGWTKRWVTSGVTVVVQDDAAAPAGKRVRITKTSTGRFALTFDAVDADANRAKVKVKALIRVSDPGSNAQSCGGPLVRASGASGAEYGYQLVHGRDSSAGRSRSMNRYVNTAAGGIGTGTANLFSYGTAFWATLEADGSNLRISYAAAATPETETANTFTDSNVAAAGWVGIFDFHTVAFDILAVGVGTNGDDAPTEAPEVDTTAPTLSSPTSSSTGASSGSGGVTTNEANGTLYAVATTSATAPTKAQVKAGQDHTGADAVWADDQAITTTGEKTFTVSGLARSTTYYMHFMHEDSSANQSDVSTSASFTTDTIDETAPTLTDASATATGDTTATGSVSTNEGNGTLYYLVGTNASATASAVKAGESQSVTGTGEQSVSLTGLTAETSYYLHFLHSDGSGNDSSVVSTAQFTTLAEPVELQLVTSGDSFNVNPTGSSVTDGGTETPTVTITPRKQRIVDSTGDNTTWRNVYFKVTGANGKRPLFRLVYANYFYGPIHATWKPWYSYDNVTWHRFTTPTKADPHYTFQLASAFTGDEVFIGFQPGYPMARVTSFLAEIKAGHPDKFHQLPSTGADNIVATLAAQTNEIGGTVPAQPFYGYGIWEDAAFSGSGDKRAVVLTCGIHPGEHVGDFTFEGFVRFLVSDHADAARLRGSYQFIIYPNVNPVGRYGGHVRGQWATAAPTKNANRDFGEDANAFQLPNSQVLATALAADLSGRELAASLDFHGMQDDPAGEPGGVRFYPETANATLLAAFETRMKTYNSGYNDRASGAGDSAITSYMQREWGSEHAYTPEAYEQHTAADGIDTWRTVGQHLARAIEDSLDDMLWDGLVPPLAVSIALALDDAAPAKLQAFLATSNLAMSDAELKALLDGA